EAAVIVDPETALVVAQGLIELRCGVERPRVGGRDVLKQVLRRRCDGRLWNHRIREDACSVQSAAGCVIGFALGYGVAELLRKLVRPVPAGDDTVHLVGDVRQIALAIGRGRYQNIARTRSDDFPRPLVVAEEKQLVANNAPTNRSAELVLDKLAFIRAEEVARIQIGV